jgi:beta-barrel assembly-enhancing protease
MMKTAKAICVTMLALAACLPASAQFGSVLGKIGDKLNKGKQVKDNYTPWTPEQEEQVGQASAARLINIFGLFENPDMVRYVNLVGNAVAAQAPRQVPYKFGILNTEVITALSLPGGYVFITRGALANMTSEAELAGTLAHEVAHVDQRHLEKEIRAQNSMKMIQSEVSQFTSGQLEQIAGASLNTALTQHYSRDKESDADRFGVTFAQKAGYQSSGLRLFLTFLENAPKSPETQRQLSLWGSTHPPFPERIASLQTQEATLPAGGVSLETRYTQYVNAAAWAAKASGQ